MKALKNTISKKAGCSKCVVQNSFFKDFIYIDRNAYIKITDKGLIKFNKLLVVVTSVEER